MLEPPEKRPDAPKAPDITLVETSAASAERAAEPTAEPVAERSAEPAVTPPAETLGVLPAVPPARRRRGPLLFVGAAVLGLVAGACAGYLIQADREPTALPSLSQPVLARAKGEPQPLSAAQDSRVRTDGDLRKLLLKKPAGAKNAEWITSVAPDGWMDLAAYADTFERPSDAYAMVVGQEFRRAAVVGWETGDRTGVEIRLVQYRQEDSLGARDSNEDNQFWGGRGSGTRSSALSGSDNGRVYVHSRPETKAGYLPVYHAEAYAWRGDLSLEVYVTGTRPIPEATVTRLAERQLERM